MVATPAPSARRLLTAFQRGTGLCLFISSAALLPAQTTLLSENFTGATVSGKAVTGSGTNGNTSNTWRSTNDGAVNTVIIQTDNLTGPNEGSTDKTLEITQASSANGYIAKFTSTTLAVGQTLTMSMDYRFTGTVTAGSSGVRFGLYDSKGTDYTALTAATYDNDDKGYRVFSAANNSSATGVLGREDGGDGSGTVGSAGGGSTDTTTLGSSVNFNQLTTTAHYTFSITRDSTTQVSFGLTINGTNYLSSAVVDNSISAIYTFDEVLIGMGNTSNYRFDNVSVILSAIPEPSTYVLLFSGLSGAAVMILRRKRR